MTVGDARGRNVSRPCYNGKHRDRVESFIQSGIDDGAEVIVGGERGRDGYFIAPTLLAGYNPDMHVVKKSVRSGCSVMSNGDEHVLNANDSHWTIQLCLRRQYNRLMT